MSERMLRKVDELAHEDGRLAPDDHVIAAWGGRIQAASAGAEVLPIARRGKMLGVPVPVAVSYLGLTETHLLIVTGGFVSCDLADIKKLTAMSTDTVTIGIVNGAQPLELDWELVGSGRRDLATAEQVIAQIEAQRSARIESIGVPERVEFAVNLGIFDLERGDLSGARTNWQLALDHAAPEHAAVAASNLAALERRDGDFAAAADYYRAALERGTAAQRPEHQFRLGEMQKSLGDRDAATQWWTEAIESVDPVWGPLSSTALGLMHHEQGDLVAAENGYRAGMTAADATQAAQAALLLGALLRQNGDWDGATEAYEQAAQFGAPAIRQAALSELAELGG